MPLKKDTGTVTGASLKQSNRGKKGALTGSERVTGSKKADSPIDTLPTESAAVPTPTSVVEKLQDIGRTTGHIVSNVAANAQAVGSLASKVSGAIQGTEADRNPASITDGTLDSSAIVSRASVEIDSAIPRMESGEAIQKGIIIAQQRNYAGVAIANTKLSQDIATLNIEQNRLMGMVIEGKTEQVHNERKAVTFHRAVVSRDTEISHLEQDRELLTQQHIRTEGTQAQTEHIRDEEQLKVEKLRESVSKQRLEIETLQYEKEKLKRDNEAKFIAGF